MNAPNDRISKAITAEVKQAHVEGVQARKAAYEKSLRDRDDELGCELEHLSGNHFGQVIHLSCGCRATITDVSWSYWHQEHRYGYRLKECTNHE